MLLQLRAMGQMACVEGLRRSNDRSAQYGLTLTEPQIQALVWRRVGWNSGRGRCLS